jgi:ubiquinone/menaquinone biosynthesis C-methylase UbiE
VRSSRLTLRYGLDAPPIVVGFGLGGFVLVVAGTLLSSGGMVVLGVVWLVIAALMTRSSLRGKLRERDRFLGALALRGDEDLLDLGTGRGLLLIGAAKRLPRGRAVGVDVWRQADQTGNTMAATLRNAALEGVVDRVDVVSADMRRLPFADESFDVVTSGLAIHNIRRASSRERALNEAARVLRPGGHIALLDYRNTQQYADTLKDLGFERISRSGLRTQMWPPVRVVTGRKPPA